jgi:tetratricopeptide (TPR) repeat protein
MPRPCPRCGRPVGDARKTCLYCGEAAPPAQAPPPTGLAANVPPPPRLPLDSSQAVVRLLGTAQEAMAKEDFTTVERMVSRVFLELHPDDLARVLASATEGWLGGMALLAGPARMAQAGVGLRQAAAAAAQKQWLEAAQHYRSVRELYSDIPRVNPMVEMLALGARWAGRETVRIQIDEALLENVVTRASGLMTTPGRKAEALPLLRQALTILDADPTRPQNQERAERIRKLVAEVEATGDGRAEGPVSELPPPGALEPGAWDELGTRILAQHPASARVCFERAARADPEQGRYWLHLAGALLALEAPDQEIISVYGLAVMKGPEQLEAWIGLASALQECHRFEEAEAAWGKVIELAPGIPHPPRQRAFCLEAEALRAQGAAWDAKAWHQEGSRRVDAKEWQMADFAFGQALERAARYPGALMGKGLANFNWAASLKEQGNAAARVRYKIASEALAAALALRPSEAYLQEVIDECRKELSPPP